MSAPKPKLTRKASAEVEEAAKSCFIITPLGDDNSETRRKADGLIKSVLRPVLEELGYMVIPPHEIEKSGSITSQIITQILEAPMVVANLTELNPNVMYEVAVRHAKRLPLVCVVERGTKLPFDIAAERTLFYVNDMMGVEDLKPRLGRAVLAAEDDEESDNPIYRTLKERSILKDLQADEDGFKSFVLRQMEEISSRLSRIQSDISPAPQMQRSTQSSGRIITRRYLVRKPEGKKSNARSLASYITSLGVDSDDFRVLVRSDGGYVIRFYTSDLGLIDAAVQAVESDGWIISRMPD